jgi:hypothetical protein
MERMELLSRPLIRVLRFRLCLENEDEFHNSFVGTRRLYVPGVVHTLTISWISSSSRYRPAFSFPFSIVSYSSLPSRGVDWSRTVTVSVFKDSSWTMISPSSYGFVVRAFRDWWTVAFLNPLFVIFLREDGVWNTRSRI